MTSLNPVDSGTPHAVDIAIISGDDERAAIYYVRTIVFVDEQAVPLEEELDAYDATATHFRVRVHEASHLPCSVVATARLVDKGGGLAKIGRVAVLKQYRGLGIGFALMRYVEEHAAAAGVMELILEAQLHALQFYEKLGYTAEGGVFLDAGIEHRLMRRRL